MKKLAIVTLTAALAASTGVAPVVDAKAMVTTTTTTNYTPMQLLEVKDGQFDEHGFAYFKLNIAQEGYYRLVGDKTGSYETAITTEENVLEAAPLQAASKLRILNKGTYYVKVKGTPNTAYHFKFAERTFNLEKEWPVSTDTWADGRDKKNVRYFPFYANRQVSATLKLTEDKHIRFYSGRKESIKSLTLRNVATGKTYTAKKISDYTFSANAPNGTYNVSLNMTDEFIKNPFIGKARISYTLGNHLPLNTTISTEHTPFNTFTLNMKKDTKIQFTVMEPNGDKRGGGRFSIYDDQHNLVKRVHIQKGQSSRTFTYTLKKGRYSVASSNMKIRTLVKDGTDTTSKFKLKNNILVHAATGKVVKGYQEYQKNLYKNGELAPGRVKYGKVPDMKLYRNGILEKGDYITKDYKYVFKDGVLLNGTYKYESQEGEGLTAIYKDGVLTHYIELKNNKLYDNGKLYKGNYVLSSYQYLVDYDEPTSTYLRLFINGTLASGYKEAMYKGETYLFKNGVAGDGKYGHLPFYYNGKVYVAGKPESGYVTLDDKLYYNHELFTGAQDSRYYKNGVHEYYLVTKEYEDKVQEAAALKAQIGQQSNEVVAALLKEKVAEVFSYLDDHDKKNRIYDDYGHMQYDDVGAAGYETPLNIPQTIKKQLEEIDAVTKQLDGAAEETHTLLQQRIKDIYKEFNLYYENGALLDGEYEGNLYEDGKLIGAILNLAYFKTETSFLNYEYKRLVSQKDEVAIKARLQEYVDAATKNLEAANTILKASQDSDYPNVNLYTDSATKTVNKSVSTLRFIQNVMNTYDAEANLTDLQETMTEGFTLLGKTIDFNGPDSSATYQEMPLAHVQDGFLDDKGYAYFKIKLTEAEGNYTFVGNDDVKSYTTFVATAPENIDRSQQLAATDIHYLEKGTHYIAVKGHPNQPYHFKLKRRTYNVESMSVLKPASSDFDRINVAKVPIYQTTQPSVTMQLTTNQHIQFLTLASNTTVIDALELKNEQTGKTYTPKKMSANRFGIFAPNGTYRVSLKSSSPSIGQHVALRYFVSPTLELNKTFSSSDGMRNRFTFVTEKDTKIQFKLSTKYDRASNSNQTFKLYNDKHEVVKKVTLKKGDKTREFTYTLKQGNYYVHLDGPDIQVTTTTK